MTTHGRGCWEGVHAGEVVSGTAGASRVDVYPWMSLPWHASSSCRTSSPARSNLDASVLAPSCCSVVDVQDFHCQRRNNFGNDVSPSAKFLSGPCQFLKTRNIRPG